MRAAVSMAFKAQATSEAHSKRPNNSFGGSAWGTNRLRMSWRCGRDSRGQHSVLRKSPVTEHAAQPDDHNGEQVGHHSLGDGRLLRRGTWRRRRGGGATRWRRGRRRRHWPTSFWVEGNVIIVIVVAAALQVDWTCVASAATPGGLAGEVTRTAALVFVTLLFCKIKNYMLAKDVFVLI
jgi:hypothetical protein